MSPRLSPLVLALLLLGAGGARSEDTRMTASVAGDPGAATLRQEPRLDAPPLHEMVPGAEVVVYPDSSPPGWFLVEMRVPGELGTLAGYLPREIVRPAEAPFTDVPAEHWAVPALTRLKEDGTLSGDAKGGFQGARGLTRFELAVLLDRALTRVQETKAALDAQVAELPAKIAEAGERLEILDEIVPRLDALVAEEKALTARIDALRTRVDANDLRLDVMDDELLDLVQHDRDQRRRISELARVNERLATELEVLRRSQPEDILASEAGFAAVVERTLARIERLALQAEVLEARMVEIEALEDEAQGG